MVAALGDWTVNKLIIALSHHGTSVSRKNNDFFDSCAYFVALLHGFIVTNILLIPGKRNFDQVGVAL